MTHYLQLRIFTTIYYKWSNPNRKKTPVVASSEITGCVGHFLVNRRGTCAKCIYYGVVQLVEIYLYVVYRLGVKIHSWAYTMKLYLFYVCLYVQAFTCTYLCITTKYRNVHGYVRRWDSCLEGKSVLSEGDCLRQNKRSHMFGFVVIFYCC